MKQKKIKISASTLFIYQKSKIKAMPARSTGDPTTSVVTTSKTTGMF